MITWFYSLGLSKVKLVQIPPDKPGKLPVSVPTNLSPHFPFKNPSNENIKDYIVSKYMMLLGNVTHLTRFKSVNTIDPAHQPLLSNTIISLITSYLLPAGPQTFMFATVSPLSRNSYVSVNPKKLCGPHAVHQSLKNIRSSTYGQQIVLSLKHYIDKMPDVVTIDGLLQMVGPFVMQYEDHYNVLYMPIGYDFDKFKIETMYPHINHTKHANGEQFGHLHAIGMTTVTSTHSECPFMENNVNSKYGMDLTIPSHMTLVSELSSIQEVQTHASSNKLYFRNQSDFSHFPVKIASMEMNKMLNAWYGKHRNTQWICIAETLHTVTHEFDKQGFSSLDPWNDCYDMPQLQCDHWLWQKLLETDKMKCMIIKKFLIDSVHKVHSNSEIDVLELTLTSFITSKVNDYNMAESTVINWEQFAQDEYNIPTVADVYHPFYFLWQDFRNTDHIVATYNGAFFPYNNGDWNIIMNKHIPSPILFEANKLLTENQQISVNISTMYDITIPNREYDCSQISGLFNNFSSTLLTTRLDCELDVFWQLLTKHSTLFAAADIRIARQFPATLLSLITGKEYENSIATHMMKSGKWATQNFHLDQLNHALTMVDPEMVNLMNTILSIVYTNTDNPNKEVFTMIEHLVVINDNLTYMMNMSDVEYALLHSLLLLSNVVVTEPVMKATIYLEAPPFDMLKQLLFSNKLVTKLSVVQSEFENPGTKNSLAFDHLLQLTGAMFEEYVVHTTQLETRKFDYSFHHLLTDRCWFTTKEHFHSTVPCPNVDFIIPSSQNCVEVIYARNASNQKQNLIAKFSKLAEECKGHNFDMPSVTILASSTTADWPMQVKRMCEEQNLPFNDILTAKQLKEMQHYLKKIKVLIMNTLSHDEQERIKVSVRLGHGWDRTNKELPNDKIDSDKFFNKLSSMCKREHEMFNLDQPGIHLSKHGPNYKNFVCNATWTGPFSNEKNPHITPWDTEFTNVLSDKMERFLIKGETNICMCKSQTKVINGEKLMMYYCTNHNETRKQQLTRCGCKREATVVERFTLSGMKITSSRFNREMATDLMNFAHTNNPPNSRVDYLIKVPPGVFQSTAKILINYLTNFSQQQNSMLLEQVRKSTHNEPDSTSLAHLMRKAQQTLSLRAGFPVSINDASHVKTCFPNDVLGKLLIAINEDDQHKFYRAIVEEKAHFKMNVANYKSSEHKCVLPVKWQTDTNAAALWEALRTEPDFEEIFMKCTLNKELWNIIYYTQLEFNKMSTLSSYEREQEQLRRKRENMHREKYDQHFPRMPERVKEIEKLMSELTMDMDLTDDQLETAINMVMDNKLIGEAQRYMTARGFTNTKNLELLRTVVKKLCKNKGFLYALHCMDIAEQVENATSSKLGASNISIRNCELSGMQLVIFMSVEPTCSFCDCMLITHEDPNASDKIGPSKSALNRLTWNPIPNTTSFASHKFQMTDVHIEQYAALPAYILDNVITELQLQQLIPPNYQLDWTLPDVNHIIESNTGLWNIEPARVDKAEGTSFLVPRYILMNMFGVSHYEKLSEKCFNVPKTTFDHWVLTKLVTQLMKMDDVCINKDKFAAGTIDSLDRLVQNKTLDEDTFATIENDKTVCEMPLLFTNGTSRSSAMMIHEVFKGYQQTRHVIDARTAKITVGNKIEEICDDVRTMRKDKTRGCDGENYIMYGLRGYTETPFDDDQTLVSIMQPKLIKHLTENVEDSLRSIDQETNLALLLATGQLNLPSCCAAMTSIGSKMLTNDHLINAEDALKTVNFSESETDMIKSTSRNQSPLYDLPPLNEMRDKANAIKATKILRVHPVLTRTDAEALLTEMGVDMAGNTTKHVIETMLKSSKDFGTHTAKEYWTTRNSEDLLPIDEEIAALHALCRESDKMHEKTSYKKIACDEINQILKCVDWNKITTIDFTKADSMIDVIRRYKEMLIEAGMTMSDTGALSKLLRILLACSPEQLPAHTLSDIYKKWNEVYPNGTTVRQQILVNVFTINLDVPDHAVPLLTLLASTNLPLEKQFDLLLKDEVNHLSLEIKTALYIMPVATHAKAAYTPQLDALMLLKKMSLKTTLKRLRRSTGMQTFKLPTSKRMNKGLSIATRMLGETLLNVSNRMETKFDRVLNSLYSANKMTYGRSFKEQLEKVRELPIKDEIADVKTDFVERVCQSLLLRVHQDACANPKLKKKIQREMSSKLYSSLRAIQPNQMFKVNTADSKTFSETTKRAWTVIVGNLDHSSWGPNHAPAFFAWQFAPRNDVLTETVTTICTIFCMEGSQKDDEIFPEMWHAWAEKTFKRDLLPNHMKGLFDFFKKFNKGARPNAFDMGQGMFHITSSDYAQCTCKLRQFMLIKITRKFGIDVTITDQQGSDDRHALWEIRPSKTSSCMTHKQLSQCSNDYVKYSIRKPEDVAFESNIQKCFEYMTIALDCMLSKCMNLKLSPKSGNGKVVSEMNSHFEECEREINPIVRETAPICKFRPIGSHFESITQLLQLCRSGYVCGSSELSILAIFLHKDTRLRKIYNFNKMESIKLLKTVSGAASLPVYSIPLNLGGSVLPLINDVALGSVGWIEENKLHMLQKTNSIFSNLLLKAETLMYKHIKTTLPDEQEEATWGVEGIPRPPFIRRGIKQKHNHDMMHTLLETNNTIHRSVIERANKTMTLLNKLDVLTQVCTPTTSKLGELQRLCQMLKKLKRSDQNPTLGTRARDTSRATRSKSFKHLCPNSSPSKGQVTAHCGHDWSVSVETVQSNIPECSGKMCSQDNFYLSWLLAAMAFVGHIVLPTADIHSLAATASKMRTQLSTVPTRFSPSYATVEIRNQSKPRQLHTSPLKLLLQLGHPQLLTYKGMSLNKTSHTDKDLNLIKILCPDEIKSFQTTVETLETGDLTDEIIDNFQKLSITVWQKTKNSLVENVEMAIPKPRDLTKYSNYKAISDVVCKSIVRGLKFELIKSPHEFATNYLLELSDVLAQKTHTMKTFLSICCSLDLEVSEAYTAITKMETSGAINSNNYSQMVSMPMVTTAVPSSVQQQIDEFNILAHVIIGKQTKDIKVKGDNVHINSTFINTKSGYMFKASAVCNDTKVTVTSTDGMNEWSIINGDDHNATQCVKRINKSLAHELTANRLPIINDVMCDELMLSATKGSFSLCVNPLQLGLSATHKQKHTIHFKVHARSVSPVYSYKTIVNPKYMLDRKKFCIVLEVDKVCRNTDIITDDYRMSVKDINTELKTLAKTSELSDDELSKKFKYLISATKPQSVITERIEAIKLQTRLKASEAKTLLTNLLTHSGLLKESTYLLLLKFSLDLMGRNNNEIEKHLTPPEFTEKHASMFHKCCSQLFPAKTPLVSIGVNLSNDDPFEPTPIKHANFHKLLSLLKPNTLKSMTVLLPSLHTELRFMHEWEAIIENRVEYPTKNIITDTLQSSQLQYLEISSMNLPERTLNLAHVTESFIIWPVTVVLNSMFDKCGNLPMFAKLTLVHSVLQHTTKCATAWSTLPLICCTAMINAYDKEALAVEKVHVQNNAKAKRRKINYHVDKVLNMKSDGETWSMYGENECQPLLDSLKMCIARLHSLNTHCDVNEIEEGDWEDV